jgi:hypothetical protein
MFQIYFTAPEVHAVGAGIPMIVMLPPRDSIPEYNPVYPSPGSGPKRKR